MVALRTLQVDVITVSSPMLWALVKADGLLDDLYQCLHKAPVRG